MIPPVLCAIAAISDPSPAIAALHAHIARVTQAYPLRLADPDPQIDRCAALLSGPLFTSMDHPWPSADGRWLEPVLQVDLAWLGVVGSRSLGDGMAQVWTSDHAALVRIVPAGAIRAAMLAPVPPTDLGRWHRRTRAIAYDALPWLTDGRTIIGVEAPFLDCDPGGLDYLLGEALADDPVGSIARLLEQARDWAAKQEPRFVHRAFGMASGTGDATMLPPVLLTIEEDSRICWGDGGSGHLCRDRDAGLLFRS